MAGIVVDVNAKIDKAQQDLERINSAVQNISVSAGKTRDRLADMVKSFAVAASSALGVTALANISSEYANMSNQIALVTGRTNELVHAQTALASIVRETRGNMLTTVSTFSTFGKALKDTGTSVDAILNATKAVQQSVAISGASTESANSALVQLGQGLASGILRGQELNSVMEQTPRIAQAIADSLGVSLGILRKIAEEGGLTSQVVFRALSSQASKINDEFSQILPTINQASSLLLRSVRGIINELDKVLGVSEKVASSMIRSSEFFLDISNSIRDSSADFLLTVGRISTELSVVGQPLKDIFKTLGKELLNSMPKGFITNTLGSELKEILRIVDDFSGKFFTDMTRGFQFFFTDLFVVETPLETAIKRLKRLSPDNWITGGVNAQTISRFLSMDTFRLYGAALRDIATELETNTTTSIAIVGNAFRSLGYDARDFFRYFGSVKDTLVTFRIGNFDTLSMSIVQTIRALTGLQINWESFIDMAIDSFGGPIGRFSVLFEDLAKGLPGIFLRIIASASRLIVSALEHMVYIVQTFWRTRGSFNNVFSLPSFDLLEASFKKGVYLYEGFSRSIQKIMRNFVRSDNFVDTLSDVIGEMKPTLDIILGAVTWFASLIPKPFIDSSKKIVLIWDIFIESLLDKTIVFDTILNKIVSFASSVKAMFSNMGKSVLSLFDFKMDFFSLSGMRDRIISFKNYIVKTFKDVAEDTKDAFSDLFKHINTAMFLAKIPGASSISKMYLKYIFKELGSELHDIAANLFDSIGDYASIQLDKVANIVKVFAITVKEYFFDIYDKVVGHSYWPDMIDGVISHTDRLSIVISKLNKFKDHVLNVFKVLFETTGKSLGFSLPTFRDGNLRVIINDVKEAMARLQAFVSERFGMIIKVAFAGVGAIAAYAFLPSFLGGIKTIIVAALTENFLTGFTSLFESASNKVFNISPALKFGQALGTVLAKAINEFVERLPELLNALLAIVSGFSKSFLSQIPIFGHAFKAMFDFTDLVGIGSAAGLIPAILFGPSLLNMFTGVKAVESFLGYWNTAYSKIAKVITGQSGGVIIEALFGALGPVRVVSAILLIAEALGTFNGILTGSPLLTYALTGGLLMAVIFGKGGIEAIKLAILKSGIGQSIGEALFGKLSTNKSDWASSLVSIVKTAFKKVEDVIVDFAAKNLKKGMQFISTILFGENPEIVKDKFKHLWISITTIIESSYSKLKDFIKNSDIFKSLFGSFSGVSANFSGFDYEGLMQKVGFRGKMEADMSKMGKFAENLGGESGIIDKLFFGKNGKRNLLIGIAAIFLLFSGFAKAAEFTVDKPKTALEDFSDTINKIFDNNPVLGWALAISTVAIPIALTALYKFREEANVLVSNFFKSFVSPNSEFAEHLAMMGDEFKRLNTRMAEFVAGKGKYIAAATGMASATLIAASSGLSWVDSLVAGIVVAGAAASAWELLGAKIIATISATALGAAAVAGAATIGLAALGVGFLGYIGLLYFGDPAEGNGVDGIMSGFDNIKQKAADLAGFGRGLSGKQAKLTDMFTPGVNESSKLSGVDTAGVSFASVQFADLSKSQTVALEDLTTKLVAEINKGAAETLTRGKPEDATSAQVQKLYTDLNNTIERLSTVRKEDVLGNTKDLNKFNQAAASDGWNLLFGNLSQNYLDIMKAVNIGLNVLARNTTENIAKKKFFTEQIEDIRSRDSTTYSSKYTAPSADDQRLQSIVNRIFNPANISDTKLSKAYGDALREYNTATQKDSQANARGSYTGLDSKVTALNKSEAAKELENIAKQVTDFQGKQLDVVNFNLDLNKVKNLLKEVNVEVDENLLFTGDWRNFGDIDDLVRQINTLGKEIKDTSGATGAKSFEERTKQIKEQANNVLLLNTRLKQKSELDNAFNEPTDSISAISLRIPDFKVSAEEIRKGFKGPVTEITKQMHELENLHLGGAVGTFGTAAMLQWLPKGIDPQVKERISHNYEAYAEFVRDRQKRLEETIRNFSTPGTQLKSLGEATGFGTSVSDLAGYSGKHIDKLIPQLNKLLTLQNEYDAKISGGDFIGASKTANSVKDLQIQMDAAKPLFKSLTDHMSELSNIGATFTISELFRVNPNDLARLRVLAREVAAIDKVAATAKTAGMSSESIYALSERRNKRLKEAEEINSRNRILSFTTELQAISTAGGKIDVNKYLRIDDATMKAYRELEQLIYRNNIILADRSGKYKPSDTKKAAGVVNQAQEATSLLNIDTESYNDKLSSLSTAFSEIGVTANDFSRLSKNARDAIAEINDQYRVKELDLAKLTFKDSNEEIEEYRKARVEMLKKMEESFADNGRPSVTFARRVTKTGNQLDLAAANLVSNMDKQLIGTMVDSLRAMERDLDINGGINTATDKVMQNEIENVRFNIGLALKRATRRRQDMLYYQAGVDFANSISSSVSDGFKSLLKGESGVRDTIEGIAANYGKKVIDTFVDGLMSTVSGPGSAFEGIFRTIGENLFNSGSDSWVGKLFSGKKQDDPSQIATLDLTAATRDLAAAFRAYLPSKAGIATNDSFKSLNQDIRYTGAQGVSNLSSNTDLYSTIVSDSNLAIPGDDYAELMKPLDDITNTKLAIDSSANKISDAITDPAIPWSLPIVAGIGLVGNLIGGSTAQIVNALLAISLILGQEQMNKLGGSIMSAGKSLLNMIPGSSLLSFLPAFADGGFVPGNVGAPVPVLAHGGELILNAKQQSSLLRKGGENTSVFNISISGDISRQTRSTILEMIPQIALGVNSQNRESGYR